MGEEFEKHHTVIASSKQRFREFRQRIRGVFRLSGTVTKAEALGAGVEERKADEKEVAPTWGRTIFDYWALIRKFRFGIVVVFVLAAISAGLEMLLPLGTGLVVDLVLQNDRLGHAEKIHWLVTSSLILLGMALVSRIFDSWREYRTQALNAGIVSLIRKALFNRFLRLPMAKLQELQTGGIASRLTGDVESVTGLAQIAIISPGVALLRLMIAVVVVLVWNWRLSLVLLGLLIPLTVISLIWIGKIRPVWDAFYHLRASIDSRLYETFNGIRVVRSFNRELRELRRFVSGHHTVLRAGLFGTLLTQVTGVLWSFLIPATGVAVMWYGGWLYLKGEAELGQILGFYGYCAALIYPVYALVGTANDLQKAGAALERILTVLREEPEDAAEHDVKEAPTGIHEIRLDNVEFSYESNLPVIRNLSLDVAGGSTVALVGPSGCGKSTLTDLLARFQTPQQGRILYAGRDIHDYSLASWRRLFGIVSQEVFLFDGTIAENIAYGVASATLEQIRRAARQANADEFISGFPRGYDSLVGERGTKLSGGQRQRISIARALLADPQILILDEATSNLDSESESLIQEALEHLRQGRTTFIIAHRLSTIANADLIVVMDRGQIVEQGTHEELIHRHGRYWRMVEEQRVIDEEAGA